MSNRKPIKFRILRLIGKNVSLNKKTPFEEVNVSKELTKEEIDEIHSCGYITPQEMANEWEMLGICAPSDVGSTERRCAQYSHNCKECLADFAKRERQYSSIISEEEDIEVKTKRLVVNEY